MKTFGVLSCNDLPEWGYSEGIVASYTEVYRVHKEDKWVGFHVLRGELPSEEDLAKLDGLVITGSKFSANDDEDWIVNLKELIQRVRDLNRPKIVGICFGHQLLAKALGGIVGKNPEQIGFVLQTEVLSPTDEAPEDPLKKELFQFSSPRNVEIHGECVEKLPQGAVTLAKSPTCDHEIVQFTENMVGIQGHPNVDPNEAKKRAWPMFSKTLKGDRVKEMEESFEKRCDHEHINASIKNFLLGN